MSVPEDTLPSLPVNNPRVKMPRFQPQCCLVILKYESSFPIHKSKHATLTVMLRFPQDSVRLWWVDLRPSEASLVLGKSFAIQS